MPGLAINVDIGDFTAWAGIFTTLGLIIVYGPRYITAWAELIRARRDRPPSDED